jgi:phage shock protein C
VLDPLYRSRDDRMIAGVAAGVADSIDADPSIIRVVWALLIFLTGGLALVAYIVMAIVVPEGPAGLADRSGAGVAGPSGSAAAMGATPPSATPGARSRRDRADRPRGGLLIGLILVVIGVVFLIREFLPFLDLSLWWPVAAIGLGVLLILFSITPRRPR